MVNQPVLSHELDILLRGWWGLGGGGWGVVGRGAQKAAG